MHAGSWNAPPWTEAAGPAGLCGLDAPPKGSTDAQQSGLVPQVARSHTHTPAQVCVLLIVLCLARLHVLCARVCAIHLKCTWDSRKHQHGHTIQTHTNTTYQLACNTTAACHSRILRKGGNCRQGQCHFFCFYFPACIYIQLCPATIAPPQILTVCWLHYLLWCRSWRPMLSQDIPVRMCWNIYLVFWRAMGGVEIADFFWLGTSIVLFSISACMSVSESQPVSVSNQLSHFLLNWQWIEEERLCVIVGMMLLTPQKNGSESIINLTPANTYKIKTRHTPHTHTHTVTQEWMKL